MRESSVDLQRFLDPEGVKAIEDAVRKAEQGTSGEITVVVLRHCWRDIRDKAKQLFLKQGLDKTAERNAVMILMVTANREFLIYGDAGIHRKVGQDFWNDVRDKMATAFAEGRFTEGMVQGVGLVGEKLASLFPAQDADKNELPDEVIIAT